MRSVFVGFESLDPENLRLHAKRQNLARSYDDAIRRCQELGVMVNGSFVFGLDADGPDVFERTVEWAVSRSIETATFHIMTPYPGTALHSRLAAEGRIRTDDWDLPQRFWKTDPAEPGLSQSETLIMDNPEWTRPKP